MQKSASFEIFEQQLRKNILILDGAMGTLKSKIIEVSVLLIGILMLKVIMIC